MKITSYRNMLTVITVFAVSFFVLSVAVSGVARASTPHGDWVLTFKRYGSSKVCVGKSVNYALTIKNNSDFVDRFWYSMALGLPSGQITAKATKGYVSTNLQFGEVGWTSGEGTYPIQPGEEQYLYIKVTTDKVGRFHTDFESWGSEFVDDDFTNNWYADDLEVVDCSK